jgi:hypothetical protein
MDITVDPIKDNEGEIDYQQTKTLEKVIISQADQHVF